MNTAGLGARRSALGLQLHHIAGVVRRIIGVPDYDNYVAHRNARHPGETVLSRSEFERERQRARYERPGARCC
jgi:uncharacterized short protein YbdD (DUF466 family)